MRDPGLPADGAPACPFVAFEDDRDARASAPDHRHRCYAEPRPAPRALAHQEAYCLSSAFAVCPTFQDWARREAAAARPSSPPPPGVRHETDPAIERGTLPPPDREPRHAPVPPPLPPHRPAARDWAAPPPWLNPDTGTEGASSPERGWADAGRPAPPFLADRPGTRAPAADGRGLAGSPADRVASGSRAGEPPAGADRPAPAGPEEPPHATTEWEATPPPRRIERRERVPAERPDYTPSPPRHPPGDPRRDEGGAVRGPSWEQPRRFEAYPTLKTRVGLPSLPGSSVLVGFIALALAAAALFFLPAFLGVGGDDEPDVTPTPAAVASVTAPPEPTATPEPTPIVHVVAQGDTLSKIATQYGLTLDQLLAANPQITDPDRIAIGDEVIIPAAGASVPTEVGGGEEVTPAP